MKAVRRLTALEPARSCRVRNRTNRRDSEHGFFREDHPTSVVTCLGMTLGIKKIVLGDNRDVLPTLPERFARLIYLVLLIIPLDNEIVLVKKRQ